MRASASPSLSLHPSPVRRGRPAPGPQEQQLHARSVGQGLGGQAGDLYDGRGRGTGGADGRARLVLARATAAAAATAADRLGGGRGRRCRRRPCQVARPCDRRPGRSRPRPGGGAGGQVGHAGRPAHAGGACELQRVGWDAGQEEEAVAAAVGGGSGGQEVSHDEMAGQTCACAAVCVCVCVCGSSWDEQRGTAASRSEEERRERAPQPAGATRAHLSFPSLCVPSHLSEGNPAPTPSLAPPAAAPADQIASAG